MSQEQPSASSRWHDSPGTSACWTGPGRVCDLPSPGPRPLGRPSPARGFSSSLPPFGPSVSSPPWPPPWPPPWAPPWPRLTLISGLAVDSAQEAVLGQKACPSSPMWKARPWWPPRRAELCSAFSSRRVLRGLDAGDRAQPPGCVSHDKMPPCGPAPPLRGERGHSLRGRCPESRDRRPSLCPTHIGPVLAPPPVPSPFSPLVLALHPDVPRCCSPLPPVCGASLSVLLLLFFQLFFRSPNVLLKIAPGSRFPDAALGRMA